MKKLGTSLTAHVNHRHPTKTVVKQGALGSTTVHKQRTGKVRVISDVTIRLDGGAAVAFRTLGGQYNAIQALTEFRRFPGKFEPQPGWTPDDLATLAKAVQHG